MRHSGHLHLPFHTHHRPARYDVDMTKGSITKHLINFALPLMVGNLFQQLYNMVDTWVVGNFVSNEAFSAVGTVTPIINMLIGFFLGLSSGAGVVISQYYGAQREEKVRQAVHTSMVLTFLLGIVFTAAGILMTPLMLRLMKTPAEVAPEQTTYLTIYFAGVMGLLIYNMGSGILRAVGDSRRPFYFLLVSAVLNTGLDLLFVLKFGMGVEGVAYATIIAQAVSALLTVWVLLRAEGCIRLELRALRMTWSVLKQIVAVGIPARVIKKITPEQLEQFCAVLGECRTMPTNFTRDVIMKAPSENLMNALQKSVLTLYSYDENPDDISVPNVLRQSLQLISKLPIISVYAYHSYRHFKFDDALVIRTPDKSMSTAENILQMIRPDGKFTPLEAKVLDVALVLHAEHGGGNNSTFTNHVVTSSGTDTYSAISASIGSLKGPRHGGANLKVLQMFDDIKEHCPDWKDKAAITEYLAKILDKKAFDGSGLIYGMGHAVYTESDPREVVLKKYAKKLSEVKGLRDEFKLYETVEKVAARLLMKKRHLYKPVCANVDFYSGFVYTML